MSTTDSGNGRHPTRADSGTGRRTAALLLPALLVLTNPGCTVLGATVGSAFDTGATERSVESVGPELLGRWVELPGPDGRTDRQGRLSLVTEEILVLEPKPDAFAAGRPDTVLREGLTTIRIGATSEGAHEGIAIGALLDLAVIAYLVGSLQGSGIGR